jgi:hypothetical protein
MKIAINRCYGGFSLSEAATRRGRELGAKWAFDICFPGEMYSDGSGPCESFYGNYYAERNDPLLIQVIEELGCEKAGGRHAEIKIVEIPDGIEFEIDEYDGMESVEETHRSWY